MIADIQIHKPKARPRETIGSRQERPRPNPTFPLSSPAIEDLTSLKPGTGTDSIVPGNIFLPSNPFASSSSDEDSGSSSGQDEFHLERYSQDARRTTQILQSRSNRSIGPQQKLPSPKRDRKPRPGLNIVTSFSTQAQRSQTDGLVIDKVHSQRPRLGPRYTTSVVSAKAEHVGGAKTGRLPDHANLSRTSVDDGSVKVVSPENWRKRSVDPGAGARLREFQAVRRKAADTADYPILMRSAATRNASAAEQSHVHNSRTTSTGYSPEARSIVIGLSVPKNEADARQAADQVDSALSRHTPDTPAIVVTPAEDSDIWKPRFFSEHRPPSSIYSAFPQREGPLSSHDTPLVPKLPRALLAQKNSDAVTAGAVTTTPDLGDRQQHAMESEVEGDKEIDSGGSAPRNSSESQEPILPPEPDTGRPRSQGWWNLMLSPLLSRKGTVVDKGGTKPTDIPPVPSGPAVPETPNTIVVSPQSSESPGTPRRLGLASARASVWSRWTSWEKERGDGTQTERTANPLQEVKQQASTNDLSEGLLKAYSSLAGVGLAAEYYHACAVDQLSDAPYFECHNHSCSEGLPRLRSLFDTRALEEPSASATMPLPLVGDSVADSNAALPQNPRVNSDMTSRTEPEELSPTLRHADTAEVVKAASVQAPEGQVQVPDEPSSRALPAQGDREDSQRETQEPVSTQGIPPQHPKMPTTVPRHLTQPVVLSPGPMSPEMPQKMVSQGAVPMTEIQQTSHRAPSLEQARPTQPPMVDQPKPASITIHNYTRHTDMPTFAASPAVMEPGNETAQPRPGSFRQSSQSAPQRKAISKDSGTDSTKRPGLLSKLRGLWRKTHPDPETATVKKRPWSLILSVPLFLIVLTCILLAIFITRTGDGTPVQSQWLNLTGYPPIPTGISTIARPDAVKEQSQCVAPSTLWSCALPKESQSEVAPNNPDQPNFRFEILFRNGTVPANMTIPVDSLSPRSDMEKRAKDPFTNDLFNPNPTPPSRADQIFMGNTTDNITQPFEGEQTPFFITFIPVFPVDPSNITSSGSNASQLLARQTSNASDSIPAPDVLDDGSAAPANLLPSSPYPTAQPIKLYNRGQEDEHYGFYMYYDKAIFLKSTAAINTSEFSNNGGVDPEDEDGGSSRQQSRLRCTFSQTRFQVKMWTNPTFGATLLGPISNINSTNGSVSSATNFNRPGSFPYPTTLSLDRHGGNINKKAVYCYGVDDLQVIQTDVKSIVPEARGIGGTLINPAPPLVNGTIDAGDDGFDQDAGGIDGGTGGCGCIWQNWN